MEVLDETFTYGGSVLVAAALFGLAWLALRAYPNFDARVRGFDEEERHADIPADQAWDARWQRIAWITLIVAGAGVASLGVGWAIPG